MHARDSRPLPLVARLTIAAAAVAYAGVAIGNGMDRAAVGRPDLLPLVPEVFRARSLVESGAQAIKAGRAGEALAQGQAAVTRAPMEDASTATLGLARLLNHDDAGARQAFLVAGSRGWRVPITQFYWMQTAYQQGDYALAAVRLDALLRQQPYLVRQEGIIGPFEADPQAGAAVVQRMLLRPNWLGLYVGDVVNITPLQLAGRETMLRALAGRGMVLGCQQIGPLTGELVRHGQIAGARDLWARHCPAAGGGLVGDRGLNQPLMDDQTFAPFSWRLFGSGDLRLAPRPAPDGRGQWLDVTNGSPLVAPVMRQMVVAPAGRYRLSWLARDDQGHASSAIEALLGCEEGNLGRVGPAQAGADGHWQAEVTIDGACAGHWLQFSLRPGPATIQVGDVALTPLR